MNFNPQVFKLRKPLYNSAFKELNLEASKTCSDVKNCEKRRTKIARFSFNELYISKKKERKKEDLINLENFRNKSCSGYDFLPNFGIPNGKVLGKKVRYGLHETAYPQQSGTDRRFTSPILPTRRKFIPCWTPDTPACVRNTGMIKLDQEPEGRISIKRTGSENE